MTIVLSMPIASDQQRDRRRDPSHRSAEPDRADAVDEFVGGDGGDASDRAHRSACANSAKIAAFCSGVASLGTVGPDHESRDLAGPIHEFLHVGQQGDDRAAFVNLLAIEDADHFDTFLHTAESYRRLWRSRLPASTLPKQHLVMVARVQQSAARSDFQFLNSGEPGAQPLMMTFGMS